MIVLFSLEGVLPVIQGICIVMIISTLYDMIFKHLFDKGVTVEDLNKWRQNHIDMEKEIEKKDSEEYSEEDLV